MNDEILREIGEIGGRIGTAPPTVAAEESADPVFIGDE
jgi:hypothetical protein